MSICLGRIRLSVQFPAALVNMRKSFERIEWHIRCDIWELAFQGSYFMSLVMMPLTLRLDSVRMSSFNTRAGKTGLRIRYIDKSRCNRRRRSFANRKGCLSIERFENITFK